MRLSRFQGCAAKVKSRLFFLLLAGSAFAALAQPGLTVSTAAVPASHFASQRAAPAPPLSDPPSSPTHQQLREAVQAHRAAERDQVRRDEAIAGRRLTAAERVELRRQLHHEWMQYAQGETVAAQASDARGWSWRVLLPWTWWQ